MADQIPDSTKLLPCPNPWCDCPDSLFVQPLNNRTLFGVQCCCGFEGPVVDDERRAIAAWNTRAAPPAMDREAVERVREAAYRQALEDVCNPLGYLQRMADAEGAKLSGMAYAIASDIGTIQRIAKEALSTLSADAIRQGEGKWRHLKRGTVYEVIGTAELQAGQLQLEHAELVIYRGEDGKLWARNSAEFHDGRFAPATPASHASDGGKA